MYRQKQYIQNIPKSESSENQELWKWGVLSLSTGTKLPKVEEVEDTGGEENSVLSLAIPYMNLLELYIMLLQKIKCRLYMTNVSLTELADDLRVFEGTPISIQEATLFKIKLSNGPQTVLGQCEIYGKSSVINALFFQAPVTRSPPLLWLATVQCPKLLKNF